MLSLKEYSKLIAMRQLFFFLLCAVTSVSFAQTKKIAFKSHSGNNANFSIALEEKMFYMDESNFGLGPLREVTTRSLDSVIYISKSMTVLVISTYLTQERSPIKANPSFEGSVKDTVYNHPLFSQKHSLDSIKSVLKRDNQYEQSAKATVFIGFDNKKSKKIKRNELLIPAGTKKDNNGNDNNFIPVERTAVPFGTSVVAIVTGIIVLSLLSGLAAWKYAASRQATSLLTGS